VATPCLHYIRIRQEEIANQAIEIVTGSNELPQGSARRAERVKLINCEAVFDVGTSKVGEFSNQFLSHSVGDRFIDSRPHLNIATVKPNLPRIRRGDDHIATDELTPVHVIAEGGGSSRIL